MVSDESVDLEKLLLRELLRQEMTAQELAILRILQERNTSPGEIYKTLTRDYDAKVPQSTVYLLVQGLAAEHKIEQVGKDRSARGRAKNIYALTERGSELLGRFDAFKATTADQYQHPMDLSEVYATLSEAGRLIETARTKLQGN